MAGKTGYTEELPGDDFDPTETPNRIFAHFDPLVGETRPTLSEFPTTGLWRNRTIMAEDTQRVYVCTNPTGTGTWRLLFRDVPFTELTGFNANWEQTDTSTDPASYSVSGRLLTLTGRVTKKAGSGETALTLPAGLRPERLESFIAFAQGTYVNIQIFPSGAIVAPGSGAGAFVGISLAHTMRMPQ